MRLCRILLLSFLITFSTFAATQNKLSNADSTRKDITVTQLKEQMKTDSTLVILDVRTKEELTGELPKIESAINIPLQELQDRIDELEPYKNKEIAVICRTGHRSSQAYVILKRHGYNVENVLGGMKAYLSNK